MRPAVAVHNVPSEPPRMSAPLDSAVRTAEGVNFVNDAPLLSSTFHPRSNFFEGQLLCNCNVARGFESAQNWHRVQQRVKVFPAPRGAPYESTQEDNPDNRSPL